MFEVAHWKASNVIFITVSLVAGRGVWVWTGGEGMLPVSQEHGMRGLRDRD